ncbi:MAG: hypothetical protein LBI40_00110 [Treponema sp.]|nr:hypothetical protein [Treponema sp.]
MSKAHRGKGIKDLLAHGKAVCPLCDRTVKVIYEEKAMDNSVKICKICKATVKHGKKKLVYS